MIRLFWLKPPMSAIKKWINKYIAPPSHSTGGMPRMIISRLEVECTAHPQVYDMMVDAIVVLHASDVASYISERLVWCDGIRMRRAIGISFHCETIRSKNRFTRARLEPLRGGGGGWWESRRMARDIVPFLCTFPLADGRRRGVDEGKPLPIAVSFKGRGAPSWLNSEPPVGRRTLTMILWGDIVGEKSQIYPSSGDHR